MVKTIYDCLEFMERLLENKSSFLYGLINFSRLSFHKHKSFNYPISNYNPHELSNLKSSNF